MPKLQYLPTWCKQLTNWKRQWCWERLKAEGEERDRGWDSWMASPIQWTWTWANSGKWEGTGKPGMLQSMGSQRVEDDLATQKQHCLRTMCTYTFLNFIELLIENVRASLIAQLEKNPPAMQDTWVWSPGREDPLEKEMATHSSILAWRIPWTEEPGRLQSTGSQEWDMT